MRIKAPCVFLLMLLSLSTGTLWAAGVKVVTPREDTDVVLHNPDMGWVLYENYALDPHPNGSATMSTLPDAAFEGCDTVAVMFAWSDVETEEGRFDWSRVDAACDYWARRGKSLHLRISTEPLFGWSHLKPAGGLGIPDWLLARLPESQKKRREEGAQFGWHVDARNPLYQERLRLFLQETNAHFSGQRTPALVDLRGFGRWGEWHTGYPYAALEDKRAALQSVLDIWSEAFPQRMLALSYSHDPDGPKELYGGPWNKFDPAFTQNYDEYLRYSAFDLALKKPNITLRRDGAGGAVYSNQRNLSEYAYRDLHRAPQMSEFVTGYSQTRKGGSDWVKWTVEDALSLHPNYIGLLGYGGRDALDFLLERPGLIAHGLRGMGYRLVPLKIVFPAEIKAGEKFTLDMEWVNRAAGRALRDYILQVRLADSKSGRMLAEAGAGPLSTSQWLQGDKQAVHAEITFRQIAGAATNGGATNGGATAKLQMALSDPASGRIIHLPLSDRTRDEFCDIGEVTIVP